MSQENIGPYSNKEVDGGPAFTKRRIKKLNTLSYAQFDIKQKTPNEFLSIFANKRSVAE